MTIATARLLGATTVTTTAAVRFPPPKYPRRGHGSRPALCPSDPSPLRVRRSRSLRARPGLRAPPASAPRGVRRPPRLPPGAPRRLRHPRPRPRRLRRASLNATSQATQAGYHQRRCTRPLRPPFPSPLRHTRPRLKNVSSSFVASPVFSRGTVLRQTETNVSCRGPIAALPGSKLRLSSLPVRLVARAELAE